MSGRKQLDLLRLNNMFHLHLLLQCIVVFIATCKHTDINSCHTFHQSADSHLLSLFFLFLLLHLLLFFHFHTLFLFLLICLLLLFFLFLFFLILYF